MDNILSSGVKNKPNKIFKLFPLFISILFIIISLGTMPGTIGHKAKYVKKDDPNSQLGLQQIRIPVALLSSTILVLIFGIVFN